MDIPSGTQGQGQGISNPSMNPNLRIPSPQPPLWMRCWQPIGTTVMNTGVLKEPRGFMRLLEWFFAIVAFAACANFSTHMSYVITCNFSGEVHQVNHTAYYPFNLGSDQIVRVGCPNSDGKVASTSDQDPPGDFGSDAKFFVFTGVVSFLSTMGILVLYVFFPSVYENENKRAPMIDFCFTVILAVFWLSASAAWANGLTSMKAIFSGDWIFMSQDSICKRTPANSFSNGVVKDCEVVFEGSFAGANISVLVGFLNFFLWTSNLWFLYKETSWFAGRSQHPTQQQPMEEG